jgi:4'-phosphopantetheinyl transferase
LVERALGENERAALSALLPSEAEKLFFTFWARKEAYLKARGLGFSVPANQVDTANLKILRVQGRAERVWRVEDIDLNAHYAAAVAGEGNDWRVTAVRAFTAPAPS